MSTGNKRIAISITSLILLAMICLILYEPAGDKPLQSVHMTAETTAETVEATMEAVTEATTEPIYTEPETTAEYTESVIQPYYEEVYTQSNVYKLTGYCPCAYCCGKSDGITASGTQATAGRTISCNSLPIGTPVTIYGNTYIVEDTGNMADNVIDVYFDSHQEALNFGVQYAEVYFN